MKTIHPLPLGKDEEDLVCMGVVKGNAETEKEGYHEVWKLKWIRILK